MSRSVQNKVAAIVLCTLASFASTVQASMIVNISEVGAKLVIDFGAGTLNTAGLTPTMHYSGCNALFTGVGGLVGGSANTFCTGFVGEISVTKSANWTLGKGSNAFSSVLGTGGLIGDENFSNNGISIFVSDNPSRAVVGINALTGFTGTVNNLSFASAGLTAGQYIQFNWGSDSLRFSTGGAPASVPEPATLALLGLGLIGFAASRRTSGK